MIRLWGLCYCAIIQRARVSLSHCRETYINLSDLHVHMYVLAQHNVRAKCNAVSVRYLNDLYQ